MTFEENMQKLSEITKKLEDGSLSLEESVKLYQEGTVLSMECSRQLTAAKLQITEHPEQEEQA